jgi:transposase
MIPEELISLRERVGLQQRVIDQQQRLIEGLQKQTDLLKEQVKALQEYLKKDSHNSHMPPSSDRFHRHPRSLRKLSSEKPGGQSGHPGNTLMLSPTSAQVIVYPVEFCQHCQRDLRDV